MTETHQLTESVKVLQKAVLILNGTFLILRRSDVSSSRPGQWDLPGGNVEWITSSIDVLNPHAAELSREIIEETGLEVPADSLQSSNVCFAGSYFTAKHDAIPAVYTLILGWKILLPEGTQTEVRLSTEHTEYRWITMDEFETYDFGFAGQKDGFIRQMVTNALHSSD